MAKKKKKFEIIVKLNTKFRIPTAKHTEWHKDKSKYNRKVKHKNEEIII